MHKNWSDPQLLLVRSQTAILTPGPSLAITCVSSVQMGYANPFQTSTFQELFTDIRNFSSQWISTTTIALWKFESPLGVQWEFTWECEGLFPHTLLHSCEYEMWLLGSVLAHTFVNPCLGHEPKVRVATLLFLFFLFIFSNFLYNCLVHGLFPHDI